MAVPTTRTKENVTITIDTERCTGCGKCILVCKDFNFRMENDKASISNTPVFGCIGCGHCMAICPADAIEITGREISKARKDYLSFSGIRQCIIKKESGEHLLLLRTEVLSGNKVKNQVKA